MSLCPTCKTREKFKTNSYCRVCESARNKARKSDPRFIRSRKNSSLKKNYGITLAQFEYMYEKQNGKCAACKTREATHLDHDHNTGAVRELLCHKCNTSIGMAGDSFELLRELSAYLERHLTKHTGDNKIF